MFKCISMVGDMQHQACLAGSVNLQLLDICSHDESQEVDMPSRRTSTWHTLRSIAMICFSSLLPVVLAPTIALSSQALNMAGRPKAASWVAAESSATEAPSGRNVQAALSACCETSASCGHSSPSCSQSAGVTSILVSILTERRMCRMSRASK